MRSDVDRFIVKPEHLTLLRNMYVGWQDCEFGAPEIDPKRPYGNSDVLGDMAELLGIPDPQAGDDWAERPKEMRDRLTQLHRETETALQIVLSTGLFEPGTYETPRYFREWRKVADA